MKKIFFRGVGGGGFPYERGGDARRLALGVKISDFGEKNVFKKAKNPNRFKRDTSTNV